MEGDGEGRFEREAAALLGGELARETAARLKAFSLFLQEEGPRRGLISARDAGRVGHRHILDSLRAVTALRPEDRLVVDLGSGAGLPGLVVASARPSIEVVVVEARRSRAAFLELAVERLGLDRVRVEQARIEHLSDSSLAGSADAAFARALAPLDRSWDLAEPLLAPGGRLIYFAGKGFAMPRRFSARMETEILSRWPIASSGPLVIMGRP